MRSTSKVRLRGFNESSYGHVAGVWRLWALRCATARLKFCAITAGSASAHPRCSARFHYTGGARLRPVQSVQPKMGLMDKQFDTIPHRERSKPALFNSAVFRDTLDRLDWRSRSPTATAIVDPLLNRPVDETLGANRLFECLAHGVDFREVNASLT